MLEREGKIIMNCLLIEPPMPESKFGVMRILASIGSLKADVCYPPYDLMVVSGILNKYNIENKIVDALAMKMQWRDIRNLIKREDPDSVVFTTTVYTMDNDAKVAKIAKAVNPNIKTIPINLAMESSRINYLERYPFLDFIPYRDPELPVLNLIRSNYKPEKVKGIYFRKGKKIIKNPGSFCPDINEFGIPNQAGIKPFLKYYKDFIAKKRPFTIVCGSRGCLNQCHHCLTRYLNPLRLRDIEGVIEELKQVKLNGIKEVKWWDGELPPNAQWGKKLFKRMIEEDLGLSWSCNTRSDNVNREMLKLMKKAGCHTLNLGADSCSQTILNNMNKNERVKQVEKTVKIIKEMGFSLFTYCTFGHKGETKETMKKTIDWIVNKLKPDYTTFTIAVPIYGTVFYDYLKKNGYLHEQNIFDESWDPSKPPKYDYIGRMEKEGIEDMTSEEMYQIVMDGWRRFYLRPKYLVKRLTTPHNLIFSLKNIPHFFSLYVFGPLKSRK
jgi:radical SAM superfamily enzyme YgiQ (UPF0313 family)